MKRERKIFDTNFDIRDKLGWFYDVDKFGKKTFCFKDIDSAVSNNYFKIKYFRSKHMVHNISTNDIIFTTGMST